MLVGKRPVSEMKRNDKGKDNRSLLSKLTGYGKPKTVNGSKTARRVNKNNQNFD